MRQCRGSLQFDEKGKQSRYPHHVFDDQERKMRALIVDDNVTNLMLIKQLVIRLGDCEPLAFESPLNALSQMPGLSFDIALVDYVMPGMDGIAFVKAIRGFPAYRDVPIVMVTTGDARQIRIDAITAGATDFVNKPIEPIEFKARLRNLMQLRQAQLQLADRLEATEAAAASRPEAELLRHIVEAAYRRDLKGLADAIADAADIMPATCDPATSPLPEDAFDRFLARLAALRALHPAPPAPARLTA
jgi:CheY-like chemotaxis protein